MTKTERRKRARAYREARSRRLALLGNEPVIVSIKSHQPDDRPHSPNMLRSQSWVTVTDVRLVKRESTRLTGWTSVVGAFDEGSAKRQMVQSGTITRGDGKRVGLAPSANRRPSPDDVKRRV